MQRPVSHTAIVVGIPTPLNDIIKELAGLLQPERFQDYCPNGLQVPGRSEVKRIATGVSANVELFKLAAAHRADLLLVHHGIFWGSGPPVLDAALKRRLQILFDADISLAAYHLPLDAHPEIGNNALIARALGGSELTPFARHHGEPIGCLADFDGAGLSAADLFGRIGKITAREPLVFDYGPRQIRRLGIVTGAGSNYLADAVAVGADAFLTGEPSERVMAQAQEAGIHFVAAGHYATETLGIQRLGEHLASNFALDHVFLDVPNPV
jgi:dinuclear metal center YbgI/SA1388 family protein